MRVARVAIQWLALTVLILRGLPGQEKVPRFQSIDQSLQQETTDKKIPGAVIAVIQDGALVHTYGFGTANIRTGEKISPDMMFRLGSTTKMVVATTALLLADRGKVNLESPLRKYVPDLPPKLGSLTLHQLLSHTAGLYDDAPMFGFPDDSALNREIRGWKDDKVFLEPGRHFSYSNPGYWLAGFILEQVEQKPFADVVKALALDRVGMVKSTFRPEVAARFPMAMGHDSKPQLIDPPANNAATWPAGSLYSNIHELSQFVVALMNKGMIGGRQAIPEQVISRELTSVVDITELKGVRYGYGLLFREYRGVKMVYHTGGRSGYGSIIRMVPDRKFAVIIIGNRTSALLSRTADKVMELMLPLKPEEKMDEKAIVMTDAEMENYVGTYFSPPGTEVEIYVSRPMPWMAHGGVLYLKRGREKIPLQKTGDNRFTNGIIEFVLEPGPDGKPEFMHGELHTLRRVREKE